MKTFFATLVIFSLAPALQAADKTTDHAVVASTSPPVDLSPVPAVAEPLVKAAEAAPVAAPEAPAPPMSCVAHLQALIDFHEKEIVSLKQMMDRWNGKVCATMKRRDDLTHDVQTKSKEVETLQGQDTKISKKQAARVKKEIARVNKDIQSINKELKSQCRELAGEIRDVSKESQGAWKDTCQQAISDIQQSQ